MTRTRTATYMRFLIVFALIGAVGVAATIYVLVHERLTLPFEQEYTIKAQFSAADGVLGGIGQPVQVVGVTVGQVSAVTLEDGVALVSMSLHADQLPHVYANATATLQPVTPLGDLEIELNPGGPPAPALPHSSTISLAQTTAPVHLSDLLSTLDADTRDYFASLVTSIAQGVGNRGPDLRRRFTALGPTSQQLGDISQALAARRTELARFVSNLAAVTRAASRDGQLASVVAAGDQTLHSLALQDGPLQQAIAQLPSTLEATQRTLTHLTPFANTLGPTLTALSPAVRRLPTMLRLLEPFDAVAVPTLTRQLRPLVTEAQPLLHTAGPAVSDLTQATPALTGDAQTLNYFLNELAYNPNDIVNGSPDEGNLFWLAWAVHNINSTFSAGDANGAIWRAAVFYNCNGAQYVKLVQPLLSLVKACPA